VTATTPGPAVDLIEHAAGIIVASKRQPHTAPYHWAGALWEAGMLVAPGTSQSVDVAAIEARVRTEVAEEIARKLAGCGERTDALTANAYACAAQIARSFAAGSPDTTPEPG
jgi:hypothetical protein